MVVEHRFECGASPYEAGLVSVVDCVWNVMAHAQKPDFVFQRNGRVHLNRQGRPFNRILAAEVCASAVVMLDTPCSEVVWRVLATPSIRQFPLHFPSPASPCAITFQLESTSAVSECVETRRDGKDCRTTWLTKCNSGISKKYILAMSKTNSTNSHVQYKSRHIITA